MVKSDIINIGNYILSYNKEPKTVHARVYPVTHLQKETFKKELDYLVEIGVLDFQGSSEWDSPNFIQANKYGRVFWISYLRYLNKAIKRKQHPLPIIHDIWRKRKGYDFFLNWTYPCNIILLNWMRISNICA